MVDQHKYIINSNTNTPDFSFLRKLKIPLKERLIQVIGQRKKYFILTGSEPGVKMGCCPSKEVEEANILVHAGILSSNAQPVPEGGCPVTTYAFRNEMRVKDDLIQFSVDQKFRNEVLKHLIKTNNPGIRIAVKWILLAFILSSLVIVINRMTNRSSGQQRASLFEQLDPSGEDQVLVVLFHFRARCEICLNMEHFTREFLNEYNAGHPEIEAVQFKLAVIDEERNINIAKQFNIYTSTLILIEFEQGREQQVEVLEKSWQLYKDEQAFREMLKDELSHFISRDNG